MHLYTQNNNKLSGLYSFISDCSNLNLYSNYIANSGQILAINSNINHFNTNIFQASNIKAANNSKIYIQDYAPSTYTTVLLNNTILNFPSLSSNIETNIVNISGTHGIFDQSCFSLTILNQQNKLQQIKSSFKWGKQLINDGSIFKFTGNLINDVVLPYKIISYNINQNNLLDKVQLDNCLNCIPKDLHQAKLCIKIKDNTTNKGLTYILSGFYNGIVEIFNDDNTIYSNSNFKFYNCQSVHINNLYLANTYYSNRDYPLLFDNVQSVLIENSNINNFCENSTDYKNDLDEKSNQYYKIDIITNVDTELYKYGIIASLSNTNLMLRNNNFNNGINNNYYKNILYFIGLKNSSIISENNNFYINNSLNINKRPIIFYSAYNTKIIAVTDKVYFNENNYVPLSSTSLIDEPVNKSVLYGYALPGGIFNHSHKEHILTTKQTEHKSQISGDLPIGCIYQLAPIKTFKFFDEQGSNYNNNQLIGYKDTYLSATMKMGLTILSSTYIYTEKELYSLSANNNIYFDNSNFLFPYKENIYNYQSKYCQNSFYFQKYYAINGTSEFMLGTATNNLDSLTNKVSNIRISKINVWNDFFTIKKDNSDQNIVIKYSMYTNYDKKTLLTSPKVKQMLT